jgi:small subunit ribosomal protein S6
MPKERTHLYEGMYIFNTALSDDGREKLLEKVTSNIVNKGGEVHKIFDQGRRRMAYEIEKKREGHYFVLFFSISTKEIAKLWREYRLNEDIFRFINLRVEQVPDKIEFQPLPE